MKQAWSDLKSFVTVVCTLTIVALVFIAAFKSEEMFQLVFVLFTNISTAVYTYYFTKKKDNNIEEQNNE